MSRVSLKIKNNKISHLGIMNSTLKEKEAHESFENQMGNVSLILPDTFSSKFMVWLDMANQSIKYTRSFSFQR